MSGHLRKISNIIEKINVPAPGLWLQSWSQGNSGLKSVTSRTRQSTCQTGCIRRAARGHWRRTECAGPGQNNSFVLLLLLLSLRRFKCSTATLKISASDLYSALFASPSRNPSASPTVGGMSFVNGAPWNTQDAVAERTEAVSP